MWVRSEVTQITSGYY